MYIYSHHSYNSNHYIVNCNLNNMNCYSLLAIVIISSFMSIYADDYSTATLKVPCLTDLSSVDDDLSTSLYHDSCHDVEGIIYRKVKEWVAKDPTLAPSILRLHFHDCVVRVYILIFFLF